MRLIVVAPDSRARSAAAATVRERRYGVEVPGPGRSRFEFEQRANHVGHFVEIARIIGIGQPVTEQHRSNLAVDFGHMGIGVGESAGISGCALRSDGECFFIAGSVAPPQP
jgi:hypothetical protein